MARFVPFYIALGLLLAWLSAAILASLPANALTARGPISTSLRNAVVTIAPERWEFFTAPPQQQSLVVFTTRTRESAMQLPQTSARNWFGLSRAQRAQGPEIATLGAAVAHWKQCDSPADPGRCLAAATSSDTEEIRNVAAYRTLCGDHIIVRQKPTPFEFRRFHYPDAAITATARIQVACN